LPGLNALPPADQRRAYADVGGHPRALEYLDALLRGGRTPFPNVAERLEAALEHRGIAHPETWMQGVAGDLDRALAETVTLAADDVLLEQLLDRLAPAPLARALLLGAAVYRVPVDEVGLWWQVSEEREPEPDPARQQRLAALQEALTQARERGEQATMETLGLAPEVMRQAEADLEALRRPPVQAPDGFASVLALLQNLTLLSPIQLTDDNPLSHTVHRWTATALARRTAPDTLRQAYHRAARYWRWRVATVPQSRAQDIEKLLEARYHHHQAEEIDEAVAVTADVCTQLDTWGAWRREEQLCRETLTWAPERSTQATAFLHQLGIIAQRRGAYDEALEWYRRSLALKEELGDRASMASSYGQIGVLFTTRGTPDAAVSWNLRSLLICMELRSPAVRTNLHWLTQQRQMLGETRFLSLLREQLSEDDVQVLLRQLDDFASNAQNDAGETATEVQRAHTEEPGDRASAAGPETLSTPPLELPPET
jgi:tetratricopeptide (TPR) repeat protein